MFSGLQPVGGVGFPAAVNMVEACAGGCVLRSETPREHIHATQALSRTAINIFFAERELLLLYAYVYVCMYVVYSK